MARTIGNEDHHSDLTTVEARQGVTFGRMRYVLGISTVLVAVAFFAIWMAYYIPS
jgi:hypothetical protein